MAVDRRGNIVGILKIVRLKVRPAMHRIHVRSRTGKATFPMDTDGMFTYVEHTMSTALDHSTKLADDARASRAPTRRCPVSNASTYCPIFNDGGGQYATIKYKITPNIKYYDDSMFSRKSCQVQ